jgi:class 3 adenylate cyclase/tetratricopeptide (TPR) repeat protein
MQQIAEWLEKLGMSEYADRFAENKIDVSVLRHLTDQDLKDIGVALGHRRKMLAAISAVAAATATEPKVFEPEPKRQDTAERRQVTVMFSDLVGSTALSARMDPEDLREVISAYQKCVAETVQRLGGFVAKYMGDGVLVYFGYPQAHEDDAERAVRAGLELIGAVSALKSNAPLQTRVGIATGIVVVGELIGSGEAQERGIVGETPNLAARLQGIAEPNTVVIAESTRKLLGALFDLQDLGEKDLKGVADPVRAWGALRPALVEGRFDALHASGLTELVGREEELELLLRRWSKAKAGEGQVVLLSGEAGIGKSRLVVALLERLTADPHTRLRYFCSPQHTDSALYPVIGQMERAAALAHGDTAQIKLEKLDVLLSRTSTTTQEVSLFAEMLSLPNDGRYPALDMTSEQRRQRTLEALVSQTEVLSRSKPVLMILEDAHWIDPTSREAFSRVVDRLRNLRVLLIVTFRPEFDPPWVGRPYVTALTLNRLAQRDIEAMIDGVTGNKLIAASIRQDIIERTDGIPLFVEEMTKAVLEAGSEGAAQRTVASIPSPAIGVPASLQASLMARLDRLGPAKEVAQIGAAIGREFSHALLSAVASKAEPELASTLDRLISAGLLFRQGVPPHASYLFKHALVQDAAYGTLLREARRAFHVRIAKTLESQFTEIAENQPELLAHHYTEAGLIEKAASLWGKAGHRSLDRSALVESIEQFMRALGLVEGLSSTPALRREEIKLRVAVINPIMHLKGYPASETKAAVERARLLIEQAEALGDSSEDSLSLYSVLYGFWAAQYTAYNGDAIRELATQFLALALKQGATIPIMVGHRLLGTSFLYRGEFSNARTHFDLAIARYDPAAHRQLRTRFGQDVRVVILCQRAWVLWHLGYPAAALADAEQSLSEAREIGQAATLAYGLMTAMIQMHCGNYANARGLAAELLSLADEIGSVYWKALGTLVQGWVSVLNGVPSDGAHKIIAGLNAMRPTGAKFMLPLSLIHLTAAHAELGQLDDACHCVDETKAAIGTTGERAYEAEAIRIAGVVALRSSEQDTAAKAQTYFEQALAVARAQQGKSLELRAAMSMAQLWRNQGKRDEARELLAPVYGWFTEG